MRLMLKRDITIAGFIACLMACLGRAGEIEPAAEVRAISVGRFSDRDIGKDLPDGWRELTFDPKKFPIQSQYKVVELNGHGAVLKASTDGGVSAIYRPVDVNPKDYPYISWRWRVENIYPGVDETTKKGDDYPARVYIGFRYDPERANLVTRAKFNLAKRRSKEGHYPPLYVLNYVWATTLEADTWIPNPWEKRSKVVAVKSGAGGLGRWHHEARHYLRDFQAIVGEDPPRIDFVAVMIDGDGSRSSGGAYFDDIKLLSAPPPDFGREVPAPPRRADD